MNRVVYVPWRFKPKGHYETYEEPTGETKKSIFGKEKEVTREAQKWVWDGYSNEHVPMKDFMQDVENKVTELNKEGYEIISVVPITRGVANYAYKTKTDTVFQGGAGWGYGYGYGYGYTSGMTIFVRKIVEG